MGTIETRKACVRALCLAAFAGSTGCGQAPATSAPTSDPTPTTLDAPASADPTDPATSENAPDADADHTRSSDLPATSRAFLEFPEQAADAAHSPALLSETGAFSNVASLEAAAGLIPYGVQTPLWSDGAVKRRWLSLPEGGKIGFDATGQWSFPEGTVFVKDFAMALDESRPDELRHLETRFWIAARGGEFYGAVYKWDEDQQEARLLIEGASEELNIVGSDGSARTQTYTYPSTASCRTCHSAASGPVRGVRTLQLNGQFDYGAAGGQNQVPANQLASWDGFGLFEAPIGDPSQYAHLSAIGDESAGLEERVKSYWDSNCSMCHNETPSSPSWDARYQTPLADQKVLMAMPLAGAGSDDVRLIYPGEPEQSSLFRRANSATPGVRMPPLLRNRIDEVYVDVLRSWILTLPPQQ